MTDFNYVLVGGNDDKMIVCRKVDINKGEIQRVIRKVFPELLQSILEKAGIKRIPIKVESCHKMHSSKFDNMVRTVEKENDWDKIPFLALHIFEKNGITYCGAT